MSFAELKRNRENSFTKLNDELSKLNSGNVRPGQDDRVWKPSVDKAGNGYAVIRFLPAPEGEDVPFVRMWDHGFQGPGGWYIEKSLTTIGQKDPLSEYNSMLWNSGIEANKDQVRKQKRRLHFFSNIIMVNDPDNPDNNGKVFLYKYGKKIFNKINEAMDPQFEDEKPINPFDLWEGADFKLKMRQVDGFRNYDKSEFDSPASIDGGDEALEAIWKSEYSLTEFHNPSEFKTYEELQTKLHRVLALDGTAPVSTSVADNFNGSSSAPKFKETSAPAQPEASFASDDDDNLSFFKKLAEE